MGENFVALDATTLVALSGAMMENERYRVAFRFAETEEEAPGEPDVWLMVVDTIDQDGVWLRRADVEPRRRKGRKHEVELFVFPDPELEYSSVDPMETPAKKPPCQRMVVGKKTLRTAPPPPPAVKKGPKNGAGAKPPKPLAPQSDTDEEEEEMEEFSEDQLVASVPAVGDIQDPRRWRAFEETDLLTAMRRRYSSPGLRDYPEQVVEDLLKLAQLLLRDADATILAQVIVDHLEQIAAYRAGATAQAITHFRSRVVGEQMTQRYRQAWVKLAKEASKDGGKPAPKTTRQWSAGGTSAPRQQQQVLNLGPAQWAKLSAEEREALKGIRAKVRN